MRANIYWMVRATCTCVNGIILVALLKAVTHIISLTMTYLLIRSLKKPHAFTAKQLNFGQKSTLEVRYNTFSVINYALSAHVDGQYLNLWFNFLPSYCEWTTVNRVQGLVLTDKNHQLHV